MTNAIAWALVLLTLPFVILWWATESRSVRIQRLRRQGQTWNQIAARYGCSPSTARRWATA
jgi:ABC-type dipeptide/oligopeptide/nickel transport system permease subunit